MTKTILNKYDFKEIHSNIYSKDFYKGKKLACVIIVYEKQHVLTMTSYKTPDKLSVMKYTGRELENTIQLCLKYNEVIELE